VPTTEEKETEETAKKCVAGSFGSFTAQFSDGLTLSLSSYGPSGEPQSGIWKCVLKSFMNYKISILSVNIF